MIPLSLKEFALAVGAHPKWVLSAASRLGGRFEYNDVEAKWLRLARVLNRDLRIPLPTAAHLAREAVGSWAGASTEREVMGPAARATDRDVAAREARATDRDVAEREDRASARDVGTREARAIDHDVPREGTASAGEVSPLEGSGLVSGVTPRETTRSRGDVSPPAGSSSDYDPAPHATRLMASQGDGVCLIVDRGRFESTFEAALAAAIAFGARRRPGRKRRPPAHFGAALARASRLKIDVGRIRATMQLPLETRLGGRDPLQIARDLGALRRRELLGRAKTAAGSDAGGNTASSAGRHGGSHASHAVPGTPIAGLVELLRRMKAARVRSVIVGELGEMVHGASMVRSQLCVELCYDPSPQNRRRIASVLWEIGAGPAWGERTPAGSGPGVSSENRSNTDGSRIEREPIVGETKVGARGTTAAMMPSTRADIRAGSSVPDDVTLVASPTLVLETTLGSLILQPAIGGVGDYDDVEGRSSVVELLGVEAPVLDLTSLRHARCWAGVRADMARVPVLDSLMAIPVVEARRREVAVRRRQWTAN